MGMTEIIEFLLTSDSDEARLSLFSEIFTLQVTADDGRRRARPHARATKTQQRMDEHPGEAMGGVLASASGTHPLFVTSFTTKIFLFLALFFTAFSPIFILSSDDQINTTMWTFAINFAMALMVFIFYAKTAIREAVLLEHAGSLGTRAAFSSTLFFSLLCFALTLAVQYYGVVVEIREGPVSHAFLYRVAGICSVLIGMAGVLLIIFEYSYTISG
jgi:hypothetical protein